METTRLIFRAWRDEDAEVLFRLASDPEVGPRAGWPPHRSADESLHIIRTVFHNETTVSVSAMLVSIHQKKYRSSFYS